MKEITKGKLLITLIFVTIAMSLGTVCGSAHIAQQTSKIIIPTSLTTSNDKISVIQEEEIENDVLINQDDKIEIQEDRQESLINRILNKNLTINIQEETPENMTNNTTDANNTDINTTENNTNTTQII